MGRKRSTKNDLEDKVVEKAILKEPPPPVNAYWHTCVKCGKMLSGPHTTQAAIRDAMTMPNVCDGGCDGET